MFFNKQLVCNVYIVASAIASSRLLFCTYLCQMYQVFQNKAFQRKIMKPMFSGGFSFRFVYHVSKKRNQWAAFSSYRIIRYSYTGKFKENLAKKGQRFKTRCRFTKTHRLLTVRIESMLRVSTPSFCSSYP